MTSVPSRVRSEYRLNNFYRKYLHAYGIPIISSGRAQDAALRRACYVVVFLLADRQDIRTWFYRRYGRAGVIASSEGVTHIPEHSWLPSWWNQRARGLGATITHPISTCEYMLGICLFSGPLTNGISETCIQRFYVRGKETLPFNLKGLDPIEPKVFLLALMQADLGPSAE